MFPHDEFKLTRQAVFALLVSAAFSQTATAAPAGTVVFATGDVNASSIDGQVRRLLKGAEISVGDTIITGENGRAQVRFTDGAFSSFQPGTRFRVDQYRYDGKIDGSEKSFFSLLKGALRTVTGLIGHANKKNYQVATPTATIGIRGTEYLAREGNSLNVSVGEGQIEVCNAAGCLIVSDGESVYVKDTSTRPEFTQQKTEVGPPPPPPPSNPDDFKVAENRGASGEPTIIPPPEPVTPPPSPPPPPPTLASGSGYLGVAVGRYTDPANETADFIFPAGNEQLPGDATFNAAGELLTYSGAICTDGCAGTFSASASAIAGGFTDGVIGWGRWDTGNATDTSGVIDPTGATLALQDVHYVVGKPTPEADMVSLNGNNVSASYSLLGYTFPTATDSNGVRTVGTEPVTGSLAAYFGTGRINFDLRIPISTEVFSVTDGYGNIIGSTAQFYGTGTSPTGCDGDCTVTVNGLFVGPDASRAGLVYQIPYTLLGTVDGAAAFSRSDVAPPPLPRGDGYLGAAAGNVYSDLYSQYYSFVVTAGSLQPGMANFDAAGALTSFSADGAEGYGGTLSATAGVVGGVAAGGLTDGIIGWGRWDSGTGNSTLSNCSFACEGSGPLKDMHYVVGQPTPMADMVTLNSTHIVGTYSLLGFTYPTALDSSGVRTVGTQPVTGSLTANFGSGNLDVTLGVPIGGNNFVVDAYGYFCPTCTGGADGWHPATFFGSGSVTDGSASGGYATISGLFVGPNASRAGLVYQFDSYFAANPIGVVNGAAAFTQTSTAIPPLLDGSGYISAMAGQYSGPGSFIMPGTNDQLPGYAQFDVTGAMLYYSGDVCLDGCSYTGYFSASSNVIAESSTDGVIGWGRWTSGSAYDSNSAFVGGTSATLQDVHYVVGQPTPVSDMNGLQLASMVGSYSLIGATSPTSSNGTVGTLPVTGSLNADFGNGNVDVTLGVPIGGNNFGISGSVSFCPQCTGVGGSANPATFAGGGLSVSGTSGGTATISGLFAGPQASRAGLVYQFDTTYAANPVGTVSGAAAFKQTFLGVP